MFKRATKGSWYAKNNQDHIALKNNWIKNRFFVSANVLYAEIDIKKYKIGQTIPNKYPGGFKEDFVRLMYHESVAVFEDESPPSTKARRTKKKMEYFLLNIKTYLLLKNLEIVFDISFVKVEPLGLASIKI